MSKRVLIAIPCFNCEKQIIRVLADIDEKLIDRVDEVVVFDNRSQDNTANVVSEVLRKRNNKKFKLFVNDQNYGLGGTFKNAVSYGKKNGFDALLFLHGDHQAEVSDSHTFIDKFLAEPDCGAFLGSRFTNQSKLIDYSLAREYANRGLNVLFTLATRQKILDIGSGLNLYRLNDLELSVVESFPDNVTFDVDLLLHYIERKIRIQFIPILWRQADEVSTASNLETGLLVLKTLVRWKLGLRNKKEPNSERSFQQIY